METALSLAKNITHFQILLATILTVYESSQNGREIASAMLNLPQGALGRFE